MTDPRLIRLRVELYTAAQTLKGDAQREFTDLIREIAMVLELLPLSDAPTPEEARPL
jgi:hypothetical protein